MTTASPVIVLAIGQKQRLALPGHGSGGFSWSVRLDGDEGCVGLDWRASERPPLPPAGGLPPPSYSLDQILVVEARAAGRVVLDCGLSRGGAAPVERRSFTIEVVPAGVVAPPVTPIIPKGR